MNAGRVREQPHRATPPRKSRAAGTPGVLAELHLSRPTAPRPAVGSPTRQPRCGALGRPRSRPPASASLYFTGYASRGGPALEPISLRGHAWLSAPRSRPSRGEAEREPFRRACIRCRATAITLDSAHAVAVLVLFALSDQAPRRSSQPSRQLGRVSRQPKEHRRCGRAQGHRRAHVN